MVRTPRNEANNKEAPINDANKKTPPDGGAVVSFRLEQCLMYSAVARDQEL